MLSAGAQAATAQPQLPRVLTETFWCAYQPGHLLRSLPARLRPSSSATVCQELARLLNWSFAVSCCCQIEPFKQRDWEAKRRENDLKDVTQAGSKLGIKAGVIQVGILLCSGHF